jgi:integral membrane protein (TIGR00529 family)
MIELLFHIPAFVKIGVAFAAILIIYRAGIPLWGSIIVSAAGLSFWSGAGLHGFAGQLRMLLAPDAVLLLAVIALLLLFTEALSRSGRMAQTIDALKGWSRDTRMLYGGLPALVGLLPMPGGALFSAPLVDSLDHGKRLDPHHKVIINYWFRHVWEYWWPLYPGVILAIRYCGLPAALYFAIQIPFTAVALGSGYFFLLRRIKGEDGSEALRFGRLDMKASLAALGPILFLVLASILGSTVLPRLGIKAAIANPVAIVAGLIVALGMIFARSSHSFAVSLKMFRDSKTWSLLTLVVSLQLFSAVISFPLDGPGKTLVASMRDEFMAAGIPFVPIAILIPFISGFVTGIAFAFVGASFPLVFALLGDNVPLHVLCATTALAYGAGYAGMLLSPVHICFVVTNEYFKTKIFPAYRYLIGPLVSVAVSVLILAGFYYIL